MSDSLFLIVDGNKIDRVSGKQPGAVEYLPAKHYNEIINWLVDTSGECEWKFNYDGQFDTSCGKVFEFFDGGPKTNGFIFCPYCCNGIIEADPPPEQESE